MHNKDFKKNLLKNLNIDISERNSINTNELSSSITFNNNNDKEF